MRRTIFAAVAALAAAAAFADFEISLDPAAKPFKDMRKTGCNQGIGFNAALESVWSVANDDWWFATNRVETSRTLKEAGANLLRLQCMNSWFRRRNAAGPKARRSNPKAAFDFYKANGIKVFVCLECASTNAVDENVEIVQWLVDNGYKDVVAGFEMGNETYGNPRYESLARYWTDFIVRAEKVWPKLPLGFNIGELFEGNPDLAHMRARLEGKDEMYRSTYFSSADFNQFSTRFMLAMAASNQLSKVGHIVWHAYGAEDPYSCSYHGIKRFRYFVDLYPELLKGKKWWLTEVRQRSDEDNRCQRIFRDSLIMAHFTLMALSQPEVDGFCHHQLTALSGALYQSNGREWYVQWRDANQSCLPDHRSGYNQPRMEVGHCGVMYRILGEALRDNPLVYQHGTSKEAGTEDSFYTSARVATETYAHRKALKERAESPGVKGEVEYLLAGDGCGRYCLLMVNTKPAAERVRVVIPGRQFAAPTYRALSCPEKYVDSREVPGDGRYWRQVSWEDTQTGFETWSNWDCKGHKYIPLPSGVNPKCDDMFVTIEPHTVQSVEFQTRAKPKGK